MSCIFTPIATAEVKFRLSPHIISGTFSPPRISQVLAVEELNSAMKFLFVFPLLLAVIFCLHQLVAGAQISSVYTKNVIFKFYDEVGEEYHSNTIRTHEEFQEDVRNNRENVAVIVHGWRESCSEEWVKMLVHNLQEFRGGSIICMDYSYFAQEENYFRLVRHFDALAEVLALKLKDLESVGYDPDNMYLFGFSFGGQ